MSRKNDGTEAWDVESIFSPPKHDFEKDSPGRKEPTTRKSPPRFLGKKRKGPGERKSPSEYSHASEFEHQRSSRQVFRSASSPESDGSSNHPFKQVFRASKSEDYGSSNAKQVFRSPSKSYEHGKREERQDSSTVAAAAAAAASVASSAASSTENNAYLVAPTPSNLEDPDAFPIKFSLSHDYKDDASFSEYLKDNILMGPSPRGSPMLGPAPSFTDPAMFPSPIQVRGSGTFDLGEAQGDGHIGFPMPKLQMSPISTPPRASRLGRTRSDISEAKLASPPRLKKAPRDHDDTSSVNSRKMPPPRFPTELIHSQSTDHLSPRIKSARSEDTAPYQPPPAYPYAAAAGTPTSYHHYNYAARTPTSYGHHHHGGPTQHLSPGQTIYNVASKSVGSPPSPYQPYPWQPSPDRRHHGTPQQSIMRAPSSEHSHHAHHATPQSAIAPHDVAMDSSPEFNPPRGNLRGQSRSGTRETTITVTAQKSGGEERTPSKAVGGQETQAPGKLDPITPSPPQRIHQAVSDESHSPTLAPTVHHPPPRQAHGPTSSGGWSDSLHMAPLPPYVQPHQAHAWGGHPLPPALPSAGSPYPHHHHHHTNPYYSPYAYHQHHQAPPTPHQAHRAIPERATSTPRDPTPGTPEVPATTQSESEAAHWRKHHHLLHQFLLQFGHCNIPQGYGVGTHYETLYQWCIDQRTEYQKMCRNKNRESEGEKSGSGGSSPEPTSMTPTRVRILTSMGFVWGQPPTSFRPGAASSAPAPASSSTGTSKPYSSWDKWMELLSDYKHIHGNVDVPLKYEPNPSLGTFVNRQRTEYRKMQNGKPTSMTPSRVEDLNRLGFTWAIRESHTSWEDRFRELKEFRDANGHCNVPKIYSRNPSLGYWVNEQRFQYRRLMKKKSSYMTDDKIQALNGLDFKWSLRETNGSWENWLKELRDYKDQHGDVDVPLKYRHNQALGAFVNRQRTEYRKLQQGLQTSLNQERIESLNELGFKWAIRVSRTPWETRLEELKKFKEQHGHCNVPSTYPKNQPLAYWVFKQRGQYRIYKKRDYVMPGEKKQMCHMTPDRISKLDAIGFEWNPPRRIK